MAIKTSIWITRVAVTLSVLTGLAGEALAECYEKAPLRPVHRTFQRRDIEEPAIYSVTRRPSQYGWAHRRYIVPGHTIWHQEDSVYRTVSTRVRVSHGWSWEKREVRGREILCRVRRPDTYETVEKRVLVSHGRRWAEREPSAVGYAHERVLLRPYKNVVRYFPPSVRNSRESLSIQPEGYRWLPSSLNPDC